MDRAGLQRDAGNRLPEHGVWKKGKKKTDMDLAGLQRNAGSEYTERDVSKKKKKN